MTQKPNVLIFGGCNGLGPQLALYLVSLQGEPLVSHLRMVDKFSIFPPTTHVGKELPKLLQDRKDWIEYRQANLTVAGMRPVPPPFHNIIQLNASHFRIHYPFPPAPLRNPFLSTPLGLILLTSEPATIAKCFTDPAPNGQPYTHVLDLSGEQAFNRPPEVQISQTLNVSLGIAREAAKQETVKAYVRSLPSFYDHVTEKKKYKEEDVEGWKPLGTRGVWWHEMIRAVASVPNLPLVVLRNALAYGPGETKGEVTTTILLGLVYRSLGEEMKFLYGPKLKKNTVHTRDVVGAAWAACEWAAGLDRARMDALAGVSLPPSGDDGVKGVEGAIQKEQGGVVAPVFNLIDDSDSNQESMGEVIANVFGIKCGFQGSIASTLAKFKFETVVEDVNEMHLVEWTNIIGNLADPPVPSTPLSPYALPYQLERRGCALDGEKLKKILGYTLTHPQFDVDSVKETIESYRADGIWPETNKYPPS